MTAAHLHRAEARYRRAVERAETARDARNAVVLQALAAGWTLQRISDATGLTRGRVSQIKNAH